MHGIEADVAEWGSQVSKTIASAMSRGGRAILHLPVRLRQRREDDITLLHRLRSAGVYSGSFPP